MKISLRALWKLWRLYKKYFLKKKLRNNGLIRDEKDERDFTYKLRRPGQIYPVSTNRVNIEEFLYRYDQGDLGSCCAFGAIEAFRRMLQVNKMSDWDPSALFAYWTLRVDKNRDCGGQIRDAFKAMNVYGICREETWPYDVRNFKNLPSQQAFMEGLDHQAITYERISPVTKEAIQDALSHGYPIVYGKDLFSSFESDWVKQTGIVPMPSKCEAMVGGHCMVIFDYDELGTVELNSWGRDWGIDGTCHFPWEYVLNEKWCNDFWVLYKSE